MSAEVIVRRTRRATGRAGNGRTRSPFGRWRRRVRISAIEPLPRAGDLLLQLLVQRQVVEHGRVLGGRGRSVVVEAIKLAEDGHRLVALRRTQGGVIAVGEVADA